MLAERIFSVLIAIEVLINGLVYAYTNQWAAHIEGGPAVARQVAMDHGFEYLDEVSCHFLIRCSFFLSFIIFRNLSPFSRQNFFKLLEHVYLPKITLLP